MSLSPWLCSWIVVGLWSGVRWGEHVRHQCTQGGAAKGPAWRISGDQSSTPCEDTECEGFTEERAPDSGEGVWFTSWNQGLVSFLVLPLPCDFG